MHKYGYQVGDYSSIGWIIKCSFSVINSLSIYVFIKLRTVLFPFILRIIKLSIFLLSSRPIQFRDNMPYHTQM